MRDSRIQLRLLASLRRTPADQMKVLMLFFPNKQVRLMAEVICGEVIRTSFEDDEYGPDPMHHEYDMKLHRWIGAEV